MLVDTTAKYGEGIFPTPNTPLERLEDLKSRLRKAEEKYGRKKPVSLAPSLSYPDGVGTSASQWVENIENLAQVGASLVLIDLSSRPVPPAKAQEFIKEFAVKVFPKFEQ